MHDTGFPPIADAHARILILGSLPGQVSLQRQQYYAQPQNAFWKIMGRLFDAGPELAYAERTQRLVENGIALWDVCASAQRPGSLDAA
ncbi:MAG: DNA-deoxyinosine glycosylase, partial [Hydrogenophilales bacterium 17-62-8]